MRAVALLAILAVFSGCFGYNSSAKKWAYAGNSILIAGGGGAIASDVLATPDPCPTTSMNGCYNPPFGGAMVAGVMLVSAGIVGIIINATRSDVKTSR
jgi:hypothetical protein